MTRAAFLPTPGDPFVLRFWADYCQKFWIDEVDRLYVNLNIPPWVSSPVVKACWESMLQFDGKLRLIGSEMTQHGDAINRMLSECGEDHIVLMEDDCPVFKSGHIDAQFKKIEKGGGYDLVGSPRLSGSQEIWDATNVRYAEDMRGQPAADQGPNYWPCMFFIAREWLLLTDRNFNAKTWPKGTFIPELQITAKEVVTGDTFVWASIQLRDRFLRSAYVCQYHSYPHDLEMRRNREHLWDGKCPWIHMGSLSGLVGGSPECWMFSSPDIFRGHLNKLAVSVRQHDSLRVEFNRRYAWVQLIFERTRNLVKLPSDLMLNYEVNLNACVRILGLDQNYIDTLKSAYKELLP